MDVQEAIKFDSRAHRLRSHPSENVRRAAAKAIKAKRTEGLDVARAILDAVPELQEKHLIDLLVDDMDVQNAGVAARHVRAGEVAVEGKIATNVRQVVHLGEKVTITASRGPKKGQVLKSFTPTADDE